MSPRPILGCIADDFTGGTDLGNTLSREGMEVVQTVGVPPGGTEFEDVDAIVVGLKSRTAAAASAIRSSLAALDWLRQRGVARYFFKYCSTFDSRAEGNIGPVADALVDALGSSFSVVCPAFPENERTVYRGYLFVGDGLLEESSMATHPLTPMTDSSVVRLMSAQTRHEVALVPYPSVAAGAWAISAALETIREGGARYAILDALDDGHLREIAEAVADLPLITGASGIARGLPSAFRRRGMLAAPRASRMFRAPEGPAAIIVGSVSAATREQVRRFDGYRVELDPRRLRTEDGAVEDGAVEDVSREASMALGVGPVLVNSSGDPDVIGEMQRRVGIERSARMIEGALTRVAVRLVAAGARRLIVAGGETSGAVVDALGVRAFRIGPEIVPGVPWCETIGAPHLALALKSGNFGGPRFFMDALERLQ